MKNRVYLYCIIFAVVFIATFWGDVCEFAGAVKSGYVEQKESREYPKPMLELELKSSNVESVHNKKTNKDIDIYRKNIIVRTDYSSEQMETVENVSMTIACFALFLLFIPNLILVLINIWKKDIFNNKFEKRITRIGIACILLNICFLAYNVVVHIEACIQFEIEGYYHKLFSDNCFTEAYIGLILLIGAQVFKMSRTLQEEQELTI